jgi:hypothetical protein
MKRLPHEIEKGLVLKAAIGVIILFFLAVCYNCSVQYEYKNGIYMPPIEKE